MNRISYLSNHSSYKPKSIENTLALLDKGATLPFIARYRKEQTGNLDEVAIADIMELNEQFDELEQRKATILKAIDEQDALTDELEQTINQATTFTVLEDIYLPYKRSRRTKAERARQAGLEPLAKIIMSQKYNDLQAKANEFVSDDIPTKEKALKGARMIIAEWINERGDIRDYIRNQLQRFSTIESSVVKSKKKEDGAQKYKDYFSWSESLRNIPSHRLLAILRANNEGFIRYKIVVDEDRIFRFMEKRLIKSTGEPAKQIEMAVKDSFKRLLFPSLSNEAMNGAKERVDEEAIEVFATNLKQLLLESPVGEKRTLALDPGFRTGCKVVCLDEQGNLLTNTAVFPHPPQNEEEATKKNILQLVSDYQIEAIAIGNGTASRETEQLIRTIDFPHSVPVFMVNESGASIYSASEIARKEFPDKDITVRGAVSIGRRLQDPLAELVKIDAKSIGVGQYQHDVDQGKLQKSLDRVVEHCVNAVGINLNTASTSLLAYVAGIGDKLAENIVDYREQSGGFRSRKEILNVPRIGEKAYEQCVGFLRVKNAKQPLDNSSVHPERYDLVRKMAEDARTTVAQLMGNEEAISGIDVSTYQSNKVGMATLNDIISELKKPGADIREKATEFRFAENVQSINDVNEGMELPGIVNNITNFGCFVDIGIKESGLVHISNLSDEFVNDVNEVVSLNQKIRVEVLGVDIQRKRIQLKLLTS